MAESKRFGELLTTIPPGHHAIYASPSPTNHQIGQPQSSNTSNRSHHHTQSNHRHSRRHSHSSHSASNQTIDTPTAMNPFLTNQMHTATFGSSQTYPGAGFLSPMTKWPIHQAQQFSPQANAGSMAGMIGMGVVGGMSPMSGMQRMGMMGPMSSMQGMSMGQAQQPYNTNPLGANPFVTTNAPGAYNGGDQIESANESQKGWGYGMQRGRSERK